MIEWFDLRFFPPAASTVAERIDTLFLFELGVLVFFTVAIAAAVLYLSVRYRTANLVDRQGAPDTSLIVEGFWFGIPLVIVLVMFGWGTSVYSTMTVLPQDEALVVHGIGKQWMWKFQHPGGQREINDLHVPVGQPVVVRLASQDVIHSFYVPAFRVKQDVVPGFTTTIWFEATEPGRYRLYCAEYCGTQHAGMGGWVHAMAPEAYADWLAGSPVEEGIEEIGERLFTELGCTGCHVNSPLAPSLEGIYGRPVALQDGTQLEADDAYLRDAILRPEKHLVAGYQPLMPTFQGRVSEEELMALLAYLRSLDGTGSPSPEVPR